MVYYQPTQKESDMTTSVADALRTAMETASAKAREKANLSQVVGEWSADDNVHVDPPLQGKPTTPQETTVNLTQTEAQPTSNRKAHNRTVGQVTSNVSRTTFEFIRDNPGTPRLQVIHILQERGFKKGSVSSIIGQLLLQRVAYQDPATTGLTTNMREYMPLKGGTVRSALVRARQLDLARSDPKRAALHRKQMTFKQRAKKTSAEADAEKLRKQRERAASARDRLAEIRADIKAKKERKAARKQSVGVDIDKAHKQAKPAPRKTEKAVKVPEIVEKVEHATPPLTGPSWAKQALLASDLQHMTPDAIVDAMNIRQANAVYKLLAQVFGK
jgi:hypothetical protein